MQHLDMMSDDIMDLPLMLSADTHDHSVQINIWLKIALVLLVLTGVYFITSEIGLLTIFSDKVLSLGDKLMNLEQSGMTLQSTMIGPLALSDLIGLLIITWALRLAMLRFRQSLVSAFILPDECPKCGYHLIRADRTRLQRIITKVLVLESMSFYCRECDEKTLIFRYDPKNFSLRQPA